MYRLPIKCFAMGTKGLEKKGMIDDSRPGSLVDGDVLRRAGAGNLENRRKETVR